MNFVITIFIPRIKLDVDYYYKLWNVENCKLNFHSASSGIFQEHTHTHIHSADILRILRTSHSM